jgi:hypothetical protein
VLIGGAPLPVSAQTILEKKHEVDYLDNEKILADYILEFQNLFVLSKDLSAEFSKELKDGEYKLNCFYNINPNSSEMLGCPGGEGGSGIVSGKFSPPLKKFNKIFPHTVQKDKQQVKVNLTFTPKDFSLKVTLNQDLDEQAEQLSNLYNAELSRIKIQLIGTPQVVIYQNTDISSVNNQVFIVTRLPRGSLDELLKNVKAESK